MRSTSALRLLLAIIAAAILAACASMGRPEGGPRDLEPPVYVSSNPTPGQLNVSGNKIVVEFNENVSLDDPMSKIVVSPAQKTTPVISSSGRKVTLELRDTLLPNTTYTIDFADAVKDLNESNVLDGLAIDFATGDDIDTLRISGMLFEARTLEPAQGMLVGVYSNLSDTAIRTLPFERITKTNQLGQFTIRNLKPGTYRIYAVNDVNRDYHWDRSEDVAFHDITIAPSTTPAVFTDTLTDAAGNDSVVSRAGTRFLPDDVLLTWFNENYVAQYLRKYQRDEARHIYLEFAAKADTLPIIRLLNSHRAGDDISKWAVTEANPTLDTLRYWITDTSLISMDTLRLAVSYMKPDSLERMTLATDSLRFVLKDANKRRKQKEQEAKKREKENDTVPPAPERIIFKVTSGGSQDINKPISFTSETPVGSIDTAGIIFETQTDTVWYAAKPPRIGRQTPLDPMKFKADYVWEAGGKYRLTILPGSVRDIYGLTNDTIRQEINVKKLDEYSTLAFNLQGLDNRPAILEILDGSDKVVAAVPVKGSTGKAEYLAPGTYYARLFIDADSNGIYTNGILDSIQPEEVYYYPKKISLKKNWGVEQTWNINELPVDRQKPMQIKKNKPKLKRGEEQENKEDDEEEDFFDDPFMNAATRNQSGNILYDDRRRY